MEVTGGDDVPVTVEVGDKVGVRVAGWVLAAGGVVDEVGDGFPAIPVIVG